MKLFSLLMLSLLSVFALAQDEDYSIKRFADYEIHFSVFNTSFLSPEVAAVYKIVRANDDAMVNISVLQKQPDGSKKPVTAAVSGSQSDLIHDLPLTFTQVREQDALYYLASFAIRHKTPVYFKINVQPEGAKSPIPLEFNRTLYRDE